MKTYLEGNQNVTIQAETEDEKRAIRLIVESHWHDKYNRQAYFQAYDPDKGTFSVCLLSEGVQNGASTPFNVISDMTPKERQKELKEIQEKYSKELRDRGL